MKTFGGQQKTSGFRVGCKKIVDLEEPLIASEETCKLKEARVIWLDHDRLIRDFPHLTDSRLQRLNILSQSSNRREQRFIEYREAWFLRHCAVISKAQAEQALVNTKIPVTSETTTAYRPPRYGRALIVEAFDDADHPCGLLDIKGVGVRPGTKPTHADHGDGLLPLREALEEYAYQQLIERIFRHAQSSFRTLPIYGVIDLGFEIKMEPAPPRTFTAAAYVRPAHKRWRNGRELPRFGTREHKLLWQVELLLRHYGVTSATSDTYRLAFDKKRGYKLFYRDEEIPGLDPRIVLGLACSCQGISPSSMNLMGAEKDSFSVSLSGINVQTTADISSDPPQIVLVDFGHFEVHRHFNDHLLSLVADRPMMWGGVIAPNSPRYVQPDGHLGTDESEWGWTQLSKQEVEDIGYPDWYSKLSRLEVFCLGLADGYRAGSLSGSTLKVELDEFVARTSRGLSDRATL